MFFTPRTMQDPNVQAHWADLWANRAMAAMATERIVEHYRPAMTPDALAVNALGTPGAEFWQQIDRNVIALRDQVPGMEIVNDLMQVQTTLPIGKTARLYTLGGEIAEDVAVSIDGQAPFSFDMSDMNTDGDPVPVFTAGYGVNWRLAEGLRTVGVDAVLDAQRAKALPYNRRLVNYMLNGDNTIQVSNYPAQGLKNHRNTIKLNLGAGGANIDLTTATPAAIIAFFSGGAFGQTRLANYVAGYDIMWVSQAIWANLQKPYIIDVNGGGTNAILGGNVMQAIMPYAGVREIRPTFALVGNQFLAYIRRQDVVTPLVGMTTGVAPVPRLMPNSNFNYQMMGAYGLSVGRTPEGYGGVLYGAAA